MIKVARGGISIDNVDIVHLKKVGRGPLGLYLIGTVPMEVCTHPMFERGPFMNSRSSTVA